MEYLPIFLDVSGKKTLVVGGEETLVDKIEMLLNAGSSVTVVASELCEGIARFRESGRIVHQTDPYSAAELTLYELVIVSSSDEQLQLEVVKDAKEARVPVNVIDFPQLCTFSIPSIVDRSPLLLAISTSGNSPTLTRIIRSRLEAMLPLAYGRLSLLVGKFRENVKEILESKKERRYFWNRIFSSPIIEMFLSGKEHEAEQALKKEIGVIDQKVQGQTIGQVCLVGAGPGDPDLLTLRALRLIQNADTIVYDRLVFPKILEYAREDAEKIYVGKKSANHSVPQDQINQKLVDLARQGKMVVRLKGGDPFIFGRGGEEIEELMASGIDFQVVPGVTAASGCSTYAGIPLTHRDYAQQCVLVTGHLKEDGEGLNWESLVQPNQTVVFYMGLSNIKTVSAELISHGMSPDMLAAIVQKGTTRNQKVFTGTVSNLPALVADNNIKPPALIIVGNVVTLHQKLVEAGFDNQLSD